VFAVEAMSASIRARQLDVNFLMVLAAVGAIAVGRAGDAAALLFLFSLSGTLEAMAMARTQSAIAGLVRLRPAEATRVTERGLETVRVEALKVGDVVEIAPFNAIPMDGLVVLGESSIDQSAMTGEAVAVAAQPGTKVIGGTQNLDGLLRVSVSSEVGDSTLDKIVSLVQTAQDNKASGERVSQWFGQRYTFVVVGAFALSWVLRSLAHEPIHEAFYASLTLLVGMSPCALVISTPATTLSALAWAARQGLLIRGGEFIELAAEVEIVALDKTGTLTTGRPTLKAMVHVPYLPEAPPIRWDQGEPMSTELLSVLGLAAAAEQYSSHPLGQAVLSAASDLGINVPAGTEAKTTPGLGISVKVGEQEVWVGRHELLSRADRMVPRSALGAVREFEAQGDTFALMSSALGTTVLAFGDRVRPSARTVLGQLRQLGIREIAMVTGDHGETARTVAAGLGIDAVYAGLMPDEKTAVIEELSNRGRVLMVGDGVNDAPSLARASVGVAMGGLGSEIALNAADVVLMTDRLDLIPQLIRLGRKTQLTVRTNLIFAAGVILLLTLGSLVARLPLPLAVVGHEGSTVLVILNGLRMLRGPGAMPTG
jgi:Cd2+/Zn2+-exporting ATPase